MEVTGVVFRQAPGFCSTTADAHNSCHCHSLSTLKKPNSFHPKQQLNRKSFVACVISDEFSDKGHLQYYNGPRMAVKEKEEMGSKKKEMKKKKKKKLKLLKGLSKNLSTFSEMGFGLHLDDGLDQQVKGQMISEATEVLLGQVQKLKEEKMESKRMKKEEKAKKKASRMRMMMMMKMKNSSSSSSSESSSSESDCDTVVNMSQLKTNTSNQDEPSPLKILEKAESRVTSSAIGGNVYYVGEEECGKKIEVCMGGKCKKSGGAMLLENFQKAVGGGAEVVGCKCMGKCREGPNVKVHNDEVSITTSLCIGVGIEDVDSIVTDFFGGSRRSSFPALSGV